MVIFPQQRLNRADIGALNSSELANKRLLVLQKPHFVLLVVLRSPSPSPCYRIDIRCDSGGVSQEVVDKNHVGTNRS